MSEEDYEEVLDLHHGIYRVKYHRLTVKSLRSLRSRLLNTTMQTRRKIGNLYEKIEKGLSDSREISGSTRESKEVV